MKRYISILLLAIFVFSVADLKELLKSDVLVQHFYETKQLDNSVSFLEFLVMHYVTDDSNNNDNERDTQLPFKSPDSFTAVNSLVFISNQPAFSFRFFSVNEKKIAIREHSSALLNYHSSVWRPPQFS